MIKVDIKEPTSQAWKDWRENADKAREKIEDAYKGWVKEADDIKSKEDLKAWKKRKPTINEDLYKAMRDWYLELFNFKCAYCETSLQVDQVGDVEHYRPKGRIQGNDRNPLPLDGKDVPRPGYYWLAYDWMNLMPACSYCNRPSQAEGAPESFGKWDLFPLADESKRAAKPGDEQRENPLLLNPYVDKPEEHLVFDRMGAVAARHDDDAPDNVSPKGQNSIEIFGLLRPRLVNARRIAYVSTWKLLKEMLHEAMEEDDEYRNQTKIDKLQTDIDAIERGKAPFSAICRMAIRRFRERTQTVQPLSG